MKDLLWTINWYKLIWFEKKNDINWILKQIIKDACAHKYSGYTSKEITQLENEINIYIKNFGIGENHKK